MKTKLLFATLILGALSMPSWAADSVTVVSWGGAYQDSVRKAFFEPFMKETGGKIIEEEFILKSGANTVAEMSKLTWPTFSAASNSNPVGRMDR